MISSIEKLKKEISKIIIGQEQVIETLILGLICKGHILLEGVPGVGKTMMINTLSKAIGLDFKRVQFTPDLLPSDIIGAEIFNAKTSEFKVKKGPIFTNILLADEINRAPAKVQSALLEAMQEKQVTISDETNSLPKPFFVLATQNPVDNSGTYSLPEAQLDRFMMQAQVTYNTIEEEMEVSRRIALEQNDKIQQVLSLEELDCLQNEIKTVHIDPQIERYIMDIVFATRYPAKYNLEELEPMIQFGGSPRSSIDLHKVSRAYAMMHGQTFVTPLDIISVCKSVLRHRIILNYEAHSQNITVDDIIEKIIKTIPLP